MELFLLKLKKPALLFSFFLIILSSYMIIFYVPEERIQGLIQKIMYIHVSSAFAAYVAFTVTAICGGMYLWKKQRFFDRIASSSSEIGILFCSIVLITGPLWGKPIWGAWWVWDARLTSTLILWLIYLAYFMVRRFSPSESGARFASVLGIIGLVDIPFINIAAEKFRTLHPPNVMKGGMTPEMGLTLIISIVSMITFYLYVLILRLELEILDDNLKMKQQLLDET